MRPRLLKGARDAISERLKVAGEWAETKPWISEADTQDVIKTVRARLKIMETACCKVV